MIHAETPTFARNAIEAMSDQELQENVAKLVAAQAAVPAAITKLSDEIDRHNEALARANFLSPLSESHEITTVKIKALIDQAQAERSRLIHGKEAAATLLRTIQDTLTYRAKNLVYRASQFVHDEWQEQYESVLPQARATLSSALALHALLTGTKPREHDLLRFVLQIVGEPVEPATIIYNDARKAAAITMTDHEEKVAAFQKQAADRKAAKANVTTTEKL